MKMTEKNNNDGKTKKIIVILYVVLIATIIGLFIEIVCDKNGAEKQAEKTYDTIENGPTEEPKGTATIAPTDNPTSTPEVEATPEPEENLMGDPVFFDNLMGVNGYYVDVYEDGTKKLRTRYYYSGEWCAYMTLERDREYLFATSYGRPECEDILTDLDNDGCEELLCQNINSENGYDVYKIESGEVLFGKINSKNPDINRLKTDPKYRSTIEIEYSNNGMLKLQEQYTICEEKNAKIYSFEPHKNERPFYYLYVCEEGKTYKAFLANFHCGQSLYVEDIDGDGKNEYIADIAMPINGGAGNDNVIVYKVIDGKMTLIDAFVTHFDRLFEDYRFDCDMEISEDRQITIIFPDGSRIPLSGKINQTVLDDIIEKGRCQIDNFFEIQFIDVDGDGVKEFVGGCFVSAGSHAYWVGDMLFAYKLDPDTHEMYVYKVVMEWRQTEDYEPGLVFG